MLTQGLIYKGLFKSRCAWQAHTIARLYELSQCTVTVLQRAAYCLAAVRAAVSCSPGLHSVLTCPAIGPNCLTGGTTALWAYIADNAHPHLRVSKTKEMGFWDALHHRYSGCRVGDYLQLLTMDEPSAGAAKQQQWDSRSQHRLPICAAMATPWVMQAQQAQEQPGAWSMSSAARLLPSQDCSVKQKLQLAQGTNSPGTTSVSTAAASSGAAVAEGILAASSTANREAMNSFHLHDSHCPKGLYLPGDVLPPKPWWWFWKKWPAQAGTSCLQQDEGQQDTGGSDSDAGPAVALGSARLLLQQDEVTPEPSSSQVLIQAAQAAPVAILGAPAQLQMEADTLQHNHARHQPMYHADITPRYMFDPAVPLRVRSLLPEARIVVILRGVLHLSWLGALLMASCCKGFGAVTVVGR